MTDTTPVVSRGLFESLTGFASTLVAILQSRMELLATDVEDARSQVTSLLILGLAALFFLGVAVVLATVLVVVTFWDSERLLVLSLLTGVYLAVGMTIAAVALQKARGSRRPFAASLSELRKDRRQLVARR